MRKSSLNHTYRLVWSRVSNAFVAVAEITKSCGKAGRAGRAGRVAATVLGMAASPWSLAQLSVAAGSGTTAVTAAPNGVPVVNITNANSAGLSHNKYNDYNVAASGLILNNRLSSAGVVQTQLAGSIQANPNLTNAATVILNEVVSTNRSVLAGFTEVAGTKANVVVANPYGITCSGCGFINTDRVTMTTGTPNIAGDGSLTGFTVNRGDVLINGTGLNASAQNILDVVTRSFTLDGQLNTKTLGLVLGNNTWNYTTGATSTVAGSGAAPSYSFDSTALGGMYAERISIKATEAGVGVRMLGNAAATVDDFTIDAAGKIEVSKAISAQRDLMLKTTSVRLIS